VRADAVAALVGKLVAAKKVGMTRAQRQAQIPAPTYTTVRDVALKAIADAPDVETAERALGEASLMTSNRKTLRLLRAAVAMKRGVAA
jgi:hypothetical protein